jgi:hypothetical protein
MVIYNIFNIKIHLLRGVERAMSKVKFNLKDIPKVNDPVRRHLINFTKEQFYVEEIKNGIPFFSEEDLVAFEKKYKKSGMTQKDIMAEIYKKGWQIKENTIKSYIQKGLIPRSTKRTKTDKGMISLYSADMMRHLNFTRYCLFSEDESIKTLLSIIKIASIDDKTLLQDASVDESITPGLSGDDCLHALWIGISRLSDDAIPWTWETLGKAFSNQKGKEAKYGKKVQEIEDLVAKLSDKIEEFEKLLESNISTSALIPFKSYSNILTSLKEKGGKE